MSDHAAAFNCAAVFLRYFNVAGAAGHLGERHDPETPPHPPRPARAVAGQTMRIYGEDHPTADGICVRDYIHVSDLAAARLLALRAAEHGHHHIYDLGNGAGFFNRQVLTTVEDVTGANLRVESALRRAGHVAVVASSDKAQSDLGWTPAYPELHWIIGDAWAFHQQQHSHAFTG